MTASRHTRLINMFMGICSNVDRWPCPLFDLGYRVRRIEQAVRLQSATAKPDMIAVSNRLAHVIVAECKGGHNIDKDQDDRYAQLAAEDLRPHAGIRGNGRLRHVVCYVDMADNHASLAPHTEFPFITFGQGRVEVHGSLGRDVVDEIFSDVSLDGAREPTSLYPFSPDDPDYVVVPLILQELTCFVWKRHGTKMDDPGAHEAILERIHRHANLISDRHWGSLVKKVSKTVKRLREESEDLRYYLSKLESEGYHPSTMQGLKNTCESLIVSYQTQARIDP